MNTVLSKLNLILTLDCEQSSRIISESLDRDLQFSERWAVRFHYLGCWSCRRFRRQIEILRHVVRQKDEADLVHAEVATTGGLSESAKQSIRAKISDQSVDR